MWEELYETHYLELLRYAVGACRSQEWAEDLAQEVFLRALQNADTLEDLGSNQCRAWLFRTLKNLLCDQYRRAARETAYAETLQEEAAALEEGYGQTENGLLLAKLSEQDRVLFHMRYLEGYNATELAQIFHIPAGTIRARLSRSRAYLKKTLRED